MKHLNKTVISKNEPALSNVLWLDSNTNTIKAYIAGSWKEITSPKDSSPKESKSVITINGKPLKEIQRDIFSADSKVLKANEVYAMWLAFLLRNGNTDYTYEVGSSFLAIGDTCDYIITPISNEKAEVKYSFLDHTISFTIEVEHGDESDSILTSAESFTVTPNDASAEYLVGPVIGYIAKRDPDTGLITTSSRVLEGKACLSRAAKDFQTSSE